MRRAATPPRLQSPLDRITAKFTRSLRWVADYFNLAVEQLPSRLVLPDVTPVVDVYKPRLVSLQYPAPAAGDVDMLLVFPTTDIDGSPLADAEWELLSLNFILTTDANAANRVVRARASSSFVTLGNFTHVAGTIVNYCLAPSGIIGNTSSLAGTLPTVQMPFPQGLRFPPGGSIQVDTANAQVGDVFAAITMMAKLHAGGGFSVIPGVTN